MFNELYYGANTFRKNDEIMKCACQKLVLFRNRLATSMGATQGVNFTQVKNARTS